MFSKTIVKISKEGLLKLFPLTTSFTRAKFYFCVFHPAAEYAKEYTKQRLVSIYTTRIRARRILLLRQLIHVPLTVEEPLNSSSLFSLLTTLGIVRVLFKRVAIKLRRGPRREINSFRFPLEKKIQKFWRGSDGFTLMDP